MPTRQSIRSLTKRQLENHERNWIKLDRWVLENFKKGFRTSISIDFNDDEMLILSTFIGTTKVLASYQKPDLFSEEFNPEQLKPFNE